MPSFDFRFQYRYVKPPEAPRPDQDKLPPKLSRLEEARRLGRRTALIYVKTSSEALIYVKTWSDQRRKSVGRWLNPGARLSPCCEMSE